MFKLRTYQRRSLKKMTKFNGRALVALPMGSGKTVLALHWIKKHKAGPAVVVCPASVKWQWQDEAWKRLKMRSVVASGRSPLTKGVIELPRKLDLFIINYDILPGWIEWINENIAPQTIVCDEAHYCKNTRAKRTKAVRELVKGKPYVFALTGTPMTNRPVELWPVLDILKPKAFGSFYHFTNIYCNRRKTRWGIEYRGAKNLERLHKKMKKHCFPAGTVVQCESGPKKIEALVHKKSTEKVLTCDTVSSAISWRPIVAHSERTPPSRMVRIQHEHGELICTPDHPIFTENGFKRAKEITVGDLLSMVRANENNTTE